MYTTWWLEQAKPTGKNKLDYYYRYKKCFTYEKYLDEIPRHMRTDITKLRLSNHPFPIEVMRYNKKKPSREDRKCNICNLPEQGDEDHYLLRCKNAEIEHIRATFAEDIRQAIPQFSSFSLQNIINYGMILHDARMYIPMATYVKNIISMYRDETQGTRVITKSPVKTRIGRIVKKPTKLDL